MDRGEGCPYKFLALDLDGTLTNNKKEVSEKNRRYISLAREAGVSIVLASGRPLIGIRKTAQELGLYEKGGYILAYNGGQIIDCGKDTDLLKRTVPEEYYDTICGVNGRFPVHPLTYDHDGVICENSENRYVLQEAYNNSIPIIKVSNLKESLKFPAVKFMVVGEPEELKKVQVYFEERFNGKLNVFFSEPYFMEITPKGIEKASALEYLLKKTGHVREELMACGDGLNDIPMLRCAGLSVAMGNAYPETKECADYVVGTNEEDGVAEAIEKFIL